MLCIKLIEVALIGSLLTMARTPYNDPQAESTFSDNVAYQRSHYYVEENRKNVLQDFHTFDERFKGEDIIGEESYKASRPAKDRSPGGHWPNGVRREQ